MKTKPKISRRSFLKFSGTALAVVAGGSLWRSIDQGVFATGQGPAYKPWQCWDQGDDDQRALIGAAILAANPHNSQPWLFRLGERQIDVYADPARNLGSVDPYRREMYIGLGCALENLQLAALARGWQAQIDLMPAAEDPAHAARVLLTPGQDPADSPLYAAISNRHTDRAAYTHQTLPTEAFMEMRALNQQSDSIRLVWLKDEPARSDFANLNIRATEAFIADAEQSADSGRWFRHDWDEIRERSDGITLDAQGNPAWLTAIGKLLPPLSQEQNDDYWLKAIRTQVESAPAFGLIAVSQRRDKATLLSAGMLYQRLHLWATTAGLAMQPLNQVVERIDRELSQGLASQMDAELHTLITEGDVQILMPFRIGYPTTTAQPSPRRSVEMVTIM